MTITTAAVLPEEAVREEASPAPSQSRYVAVSVAVTFVLFLVGVGGGLWLYEGEFVFGFGVGLFTAFWGGPGFGVMAGMSLYNLKVERLAKH